MDARRAPVGDSSERIEARLARNRSRATARDSAVLIYDGECGFCRRMLLLGRRHLKWTPRAVGFQETDVSHFGVSLEQARTSIWLCRRGRPPQHGADAVAMILRLQEGAAWRVVGQMMATPPISWIAAAVYRVVSRYRHHLPGSTCAVPPEA